MRIFRSASTLLFLVALPALARAQERGAVTGTVLNAATERPIVGAQITISGTSVGGVTNQQGRYLIPSVPVGTREVRVTVIGYSRGTETVTIMPGGTATADFRLQTSVIQLDNLVVAVTGRSQRQREIGSTVANINVAEVDLAPVTSMSELLQGRASGVQVRQSGGTTGAARASASAARTASGPEEAARPRPGTTTSTGRLCGPANDRRTAASRDQLSRVSGQNDGNANAGMNVDLPEEKVNNAGRRPRCRAESPARE
jgi:hypothetical protein